jgi:hypothetical protein
MDRHDRCLRGEVDGHMHAVETDAAGQRSLVVVGEPGDYSIFVERMDSSASH